MKVITETEFRKVIKAIKERGTFTSCEALPYYPEFLEVELVAGEIKNPPPMLHVIPVWPDRKIA